jgi:hypothetical protein
VRAPQCRHAVERGQRRIRIAGDVHHREIERDERVHQRDDGHADHHELARHRRPHRGLPAQVTARRADDAEHGLYPRQHQREDQGELPKLGNHVP